MFDFGFSEIVVILMISLIVLGPERLPKAARQVGLWVGKIRAFVSSAKSDLSQQLDASELSSVKQEITESIHALQSTASHLTALDSLPEQKTPDDFLPQYTAPEKSLKNKSVQTRRQNRIKLPPKPKLRGSKRALINRK